MVSLPSNLGFLFLSRCLIFKVQSLTLSRGQLKEYITYSPSCQYFFESFLRFFSNLFSFKLSWLFSRSFRVFPWELVYIITSDSFCQHFLQTFLCIFDYICPFLYSAPGVFVPVCRLYTIYCAMSLFSSLYSIWGMAKTYLSVAIYAHSICLSYYTIYIYSILHIFIWIDIKSCKLIIQIVFPAATCNRRVWTHLLIPGATRSIIYNIV